MNLFGSKDKANLPALIKPSLVNFDVTKNVIHKVTVDGAIEINSALGILDLSLIDDFLDTSMGGELTGGWVDYAIYALGRSLRR